MPGEDLNPELQLHLNPTAFLFEVRLEVRDLDQAIAFYQSLDLELASLAADRSVAIMLIGSHGARMLSLWHVAAANHKNS